MNPNKFSPPNNTEFIQLQIRRQWTLDNFHYLFLIATCYLLFVIFGPSAVKRLNLGPYSLKRPLAVWNAILAVFSTIVLVIVTAESLHRLFSLGFYGSLCVTDTMYTGLNGQSQWLFAWSKIAELGDTIFLVLRHRPVSFLHWYHHVTVLLFCFYQYACETAPSQWGVTFNAAVHSVMYAYFCATALGMSVPKPARMAVTIAQLGQFVIGVFCCTVCFIAVIVQSGVHPWSCDIRQDVAAYQMIIYTTYLYLFAKYFVDTYFGGKIGWSKLFGKSKSSKKVN